jgi:hypothetical protein
VFSLLLDLTALQNFLGIGELTGNLESSKAFDFGLVGIEDLVGIGGPLSCLLESRHLEILFW